MTDEGLPADRLNRILTAVETIEESLGVLARKQQIGREDYKADSDTRDIVERRFVKMTEAAIDIAEELVKHEREQPPASNPASMRALGEIGVLSGSLAEEMAQGTRFRNVLSHTYGNIIDHDVERIDDVAEFGLGSDGGSIARYAREHSRLILTQDDDFFTGLDIEDTAGVLFQRDQTLSSGWWMTSAR